MKKIIFLAAACLGAWAAQAQQSPQYSLYMFNKQALNPASIGSRGSLSLNADYRSQWQRVEGAPETFNLGVQFAPNNGAKYGRHAGGLLFFRDNIGVSNNTGIHLQYAYRLPVSDKTMLSFGVQSVLNNFNNNLQKLNPADANDPVVDANGNNSFQSNAGAGIYAYANNFYAGISVPELLENKKDASGNPTRINKRHLFVMGGYLQPLNEAFKLRANALIKYVPLDEFESPNSFDFNLSAIYLDRFTLGASVRKGGTLTAVSQIQLTRTLNLGYAYDFKTGNYRRAGASHEVFLGFDINALKGPFTTPRFVSFF